MKKPPDFETLVAAHSGEILAYLWRMARDPDDAQDCLQDTFIRALRAYDRLESGANHRAWLYRIATNVALTYLKRRSRSDGRQTPLDPETAGGGLAPDEALARRQLLAEVALAVDGLPAQQRAALILRKYQEMSYGEVANALGCTEAAARANVYQAVKKLRLQVISYAY